MISVTLDSKKLDFALERLAQAAKVDLGKVIKQEGGNVAKSIMMILPPTAMVAQKDPAKKPKSQGLSQKAYQQGTNAIKGDLFGGKKKTISRYSSIGLFQRIGSSTQIAPRKTDGATIGVNLGWERSKSVRIMRQFWIPGASIGAMKAFHKRYKNPKTGRTGHISQSVIGRWKVQDQMWIGNDQAESYFNELKSKVGWAKAGFAAAAIACGIRVPAWVRRHAGDAGTEAHSFNANPFVTGTAKNIKVPDPERYVKSAMEFREKITLLKVQAILANRAVNLGFAKIDGAGKVTENMPT